MPANWPPVSHFSCLFQGIVDAPRSSGSSTRRACDLSDAQETSTALLAHRSASGRFRIRSKMTAGINYSVSRLHLDATRQSAGHYIGDAGGRFNRRNTQLTDARAPAVNEEIGVWL